MNLQMNIYDIHVQLTADDGLFAWAMDQLKQDFDFFIVNTNESAEISISFNNITLPAHRTQLLSKAIPVFKTRMCQAYQAGSVRICKYDEDCVVFGFPRQVAEIYSSSPTQSYQAAYYYILSTVGEILDSKGIHRMHAVALQSERDTICLPLDSGQGKTTRALKELYDGQQHILGDEIVLTDGKNIFPFPIRMAVRAEVYELWKLRVSHVQPVDRGDAGIKYMLDIPALRRGQGTAVFTIQVSGRISFFLKFIVGWGVPQMREYMIRPQNVFLLMKIFCLRILCAYRLRSKMVVSG